MQKVYVFSEEMDKCGRTLRKKEREIEKRKGIVKASFQSKLLTVVFSIEIHEPSQINIMAPGGDASRRKCELERCETLNNL